jgi:signal transduction histidine kinase/ActR/RegA family two-component response regulator
MPGALSQAFYDITQLLESAEGSKARVMRVLERLRSLVPYERCAVLHVSPGSEPLLIAAPGLQPAEKAELAALIHTLFHRLGERQGAVQEASSACTRLAVPLIGLDSLVGVLFVDRPEGSYDEQHLRLLSVVAAELAAYFSMLQAFQREEARAEALAQAQRTAEAAVRAKDEFLALVSHELRTPLNSILAWADALRSKDTSEADRKRAVEAIERAVRAQAKLVSDLLDLSCITAATLRLELGAVDPAQLIKEVISSLQPRATRKAIKLVFTLDESVTLLADRHRLNQVILSLVTNAIKFTPNGGHVDVRLEREGVLARIRVIDSGAGIKAEVLPKLFQPFSPIDSSTTRAHGGLGVGLALVRDLVELHGGRVRAESPGERQGSTFTVELPIDAAVPTAAQLRVPSGLGLNQQPAATEARDWVAPRALTGVRVLIVDDDPDIGEVLQFVLEAQGALVSVALSAAEALAALTRSMPDVLLSDLAMPGGSGYDLMRDVIAREGEHAPPAAALSAYAPGQDLREALASGFRMLLEKPIAPAALIEAVATLAGEKSGKVATPLRVERAFVD